jgi:hypothetical protein
MKEAQNEQRLNATIQKVVATEFYKNSDSGLQHALTCKSFAGTLASALEFKQIGLTYEQWEELIDSGLGPAGRAVLKELFNQ